jgi:hypothetical protein
MSGAIILLPQYVFIAWCSVKAQGQLYLFYRNAAHSCRNERKTNVDWVLNYCTYAYQYLAMETLLIVAASI